MLSIFSQFLFINFALIILPNVSFLIFVTKEGMVIWVSEEQLPNASFPIFVTEEGIVTCESKEQLLNAFSSI